MKSLIITTIASVFGSKVQAEPTRQENPYFSSVQAEFFEASASLRQAQRNLDNAEPSYIDIAINDLNIATWRADNASRKARLELGLPPTDRGMRQLAWLSSEGAGHELHAE
jgi:hypothetical protein